MLYRCLLLLFLLAISTTSCESNGLQVATLCHRDTVYHNQFLDSAGHWVSDLQFTGGCLRTDSAVVDFCRRVYPARAIVNATQLTDVAMVDSWCRVELGECTDTVWVRPYKCIEATEASTTEVVDNEPDVDSTVSHREATSYSFSNDLNSCRSEQVSNASLCWGKQQWRSVAEDHCVRFSMKLTSLFAVYPCGADVFTGVDFECCPHNMPGDDSKHDNDEKQDPFQLQETVEKNMPTTSFADEYDEYSEDDEQIEDMEDEIEDIESDVYQTPTRDPYYTKFDPSVEHSAFKDAIKRLDESYRGQSTKIMNEWDELEKRYSDLKTTDKERAEHFKLKMTNRFQRLVAALKRRSTSEKLRLRALHQQRMTAHVANLRRDALACYNRSLSAPSPSAASVHRCLGRLLRALYRDRHHTIAHFRHLSVVRPAQAASSRYAAAKHLRDVQHDVDFSVHRLDQFPQVKFVLMPAVRQMLGRLERRDSVPVELSYVQQADTADYNINNIKESVIHVANTDTDSDSLKSYKGQQLANKEGSVLDAVDEQKRQPLSEQSVTIEVQTLPVQHSAVASPVDSAVTTYRLTAPSVNRWRHDSRVYTLGGLVSAAVVTAIVCGMIAARHRNRRRRRSSDNLHDFVEIDRPVHLNDVHLDHLQANGYENPTYKYFDK